MKTVGKQLQDARAAKGWSPELAARETKIRVDRLHDLESDDYSNFSSPTYARGFVRTYARALGIDEYKILRQLDNKLPEDDNATFVNDSGVPYMPEPSKPHKPFEISRGVYIAGGATAVVLLLIGFILIQSYRAGYFASAPAATPTVPATNTPAVAPEAEVARAQLADPNAPPVPVPVDAVPAAPPAAPVAAPVALPATPTDINGAPRALPVNPVDLTAGTNQLSPAGVPVAPVASAPAPAVVPPAAKAPASAPGLSPAPDNAPVVSTSVPMAAPGAPSPAADAGAPVASATPVPGTAPSIAPPAESAPTTTVPATPAPVITTAPLPAASTTAALESAPSPATVPEPTNPASATASTTTVPPRALPVDLNAETAPAEAPAADQAEAAAKPHVAHALSARDSNTSRPSVNLAAAQAATDTLIAATTPPPNAPPNVGAISPAALTAAPADASAVATTPPPEASPSSLAPAVIAAPEAPGSGNDSTAALTGAADNATTTVAASPDGEAGAGGKFHGKRLVLTASHDSFVRVIALDGANAGQVRYSSMLHSGQSISFNDRKYSINVADPSAVDIALDGINYGPHSDNSEPDTFVVESHIP